MIVSPLVIGVDRHTVESGERGLIIETATAMEVDPRALDHIAWRAVSGRELVD